MKKQKHLEKIHSALFNNVELKGILGGGGTYTPANANTSSVDYTYNPLWYCTPDFDTEDDKYVIQPGADDCPETSK